MEILNQCLTRQMTCEPPALHAVGGVWFHGSLLAEGCEKKAETRGKERTLRWGLVLDELMRCSWEWQQKLSL